MCDFKYWYLNYNMAKKLYVEHLLEKWGADIKKGGICRAYRRYTSFDYCYGYFYKHHKDAKYFALKQNIEKSCLHLGFYLASWGMYRGSTKLLQTSFKVYEPLIKGVIAKQGREAWEIDVCNYEENMRRLAKLHNSISKVLNKILNEDPSETLISKIMLGIFGCVPAFDTNVQKGLKRAGESYHKSFEQNISAIERIYMANKAKIDRASNRYRVLNFETGRQSTKYYTKTKIIDMVLFELGKIK